MQAIKAAQIITEDAIIKNGALLLENERIKAILNEEESQNLDFQIEIKTYHNASIFAGLIDTHIHGAAGADTMDATPQALASIGEFLATQGTTMWMPTTVSAHVNELKAAINNVENFLHSHAHKHPKAAKIMGMFLESNFINVEKKGAHSSECIQKIDEALIDELISHKVVKALILAPELDGAQELCSKLTAKGLKVSLGHSCASYEQAQSAFSKGADACVHAYCAMSSLHHRQVGLIGAAMLNDKIYTELIADGVHVSIPAMQILLRMKPASKVILVSDACCGTGLEDGDYMLGPLPIKITNHIARTHDGALAGSTTTMLQSLRLMINELGVDVITASKYTSLNPAQRFNIADDYGSLAVGKIADFIVLDEQLNLLSTYLNGAEVYRA